MADDTNTVARSMRMAAARMNQRPDRSPQEPTERWTGLRSSWRTAVPTSQSGEPSSFLVEADAIGGIAPAIYKLHDANLSQQQRSSPYSLGMVGEQLVVLEGWLDTPAGG